MGVVPKRPGEETGESNDENLYTFSSRPTTPGERRIPDILVRFQAVGETHPCIAHQYFKVNSSTPLNQIRRHIQSIFKPVFEKGFIFLKGDREILKNTEAKLTLFDILPKLYHGKPSRAFQYPSVHYKQVSVDYEGMRYNVTCACVVFLFERSQMSHWQRNDLQAELSADVIQGFSFIPLNIMSCTGELIDKRTTTMHMHAACAEKSELEAALHQMKREDYTAENLRDQRLANPLHYIATNGIQAALYNMKREDHASENMRVKRLANIPHHTSGNGNQAVLRKTKREDNAAENLRKQLLANPRYNTEANRHSAMCLTLGMCETLVSSLGKEIIYQKDVNGKTPLHCALYRKQIDVVVYLLQLDPDLLTQDDLGNSCFELLIRLKDSELSKIMSTVRREDCVGDLACLHFACAAMRTKNIKEARRFSKKLEPANFLLELGRSPLHLAAILGDRETAETIIEKGYALMDRDSVGFLPFHYACQYGRIKLLKLLYSAQFDDEDINEAVVLALRHRKYQCAKKACLLASTLTFEEDTILYIMKALERNFEKCWEHCLPMLAFDKSVLGMYLLQYAREGLEIAVSRICKLGVDVNFQDLMSRTSLHESSQMGHTKIAKILMDNDADPNIVDWRRSTPLHYACMAGHVDVVKLLLGYSKVRADIQDVCGRTPFMTAAYYKRQNVLEHLVSSDLGNLNIHAVDRYGCNILHYAINMTEGQSDLLLARYSAFAGHPGEDKIKIGNPQFDGEKVMSWYNKSSSGKYVFDGEKTSDGTISVPFAYKREVCSWNDRKKHLQIKQPKKLARPVFLCSKCGKGYRPYMRKDGYLKPRHCCSRDEQMDTSTDMLPFQCHHAITWSDGSTAGHLAARMKSDHLLKKLIRMFPQMAFERDDIGRTLLELSVDLLSPKILTIALECTEGDRRVRELVSRAINVSHWGKTETSRLKCVDLLLSNNTIFPLDADVLEEGHEWIYHRDLSPLALATKLNKIHIVKSILHHNISSASQALCVAVENGNLNLLEILLKHFHESKQSKETVYKAFNLDDACSSSNVSLPLIKLLCEEFPEMLKLDSFSGTFGPLYHLLQKRQPYKKKTRSVDAKKDLEEIAVYLIKKGLYHGLVKVDERDTASRGPQNGDETEYRYPHQYHLTCQSVKAAVDNSSWEVLGVLMHEQGDLFWKCFFTSIECSVQCERYSPRGEGSNIQENKRQYLFEIFWRLFKTDVPSQLVGQFLRQGVKSLQTIGKEEQVSAKWDYASYLPHRLISQFYHGDMLVRSNLNALEEMLPSSEHLNYLEKLLLSLSVFLHSDALIRLLILAPSLFPLLKLPNRNMSVSRKAFSYLRNSLCLKHSMSSPFLSHPNMTLLHVVCCSSDVELLQEILQSPFSLNINERSKIETSTEKSPGLHLDTKPEGESPHNDESTGSENSEMVGLSALDVASACGHYETVKLLLKYGAVPDSHTLQACIVGHKFKGIKSWSDIICGFPKADPNEEKARGKVAVRLIKETWEGKESGPSEQHVILAVKHKRWDILDCLLQRGISMDSVFSDSDLSRIVFQFSTEAICNKLVSVSDVKLIIHPECLGEAFHGASLRENIHVLQKLLETFNETIENYNVLQVKTFLQISKNEGRSRQETVLHILAKKGWFSVMKSLVCQLQKQKGEDGSEISKKKGNYNEFSNEKGTGSNGKSRNRGTEKEDDEEDDAAADETEEQDNKVENYLRNARYLTQESFVNVKDEHQRTPLWYAIVNRHWNIANFLILYNANTGSLPVPGLDVKRTFEDAQNMTPIETLSIEKVAGGKRKFKNHANENSNPPIFELKSYYTPIQPKTVLKGLQRNNIGPMPLKRRSQKFSEQEMKVRKLIPIMNEAKNVGCTILHIAVGHRYVSLVQEILKVNPLLAKTLDRSGYPAYVYAVSANDGELFRMLFDEQLMNIRLGNLCLDIAIRSLLDQRHLRTSAEKSLLRTMKLIYEPYKEFGETPIPIPELEKQLKNFKGAKAKVKYILSGLGDGGDFVKDIVTFLDNVERLLTGLDWYPALSTRRNMEEGSLKEFIEFFMDKLMITKIESSSIYCMSVIGDEWILHKLLEQATNSAKNRKKFIPFIGELSFMDILVIIGIAKNQQWYGDTGRLTMTLDKLPAVFNLQVLQLAADKGCWFDLTRIAKDVFKHESELTDTWTYVCCAAAREGHEELFSNIFENMDLSKLDEEEKVKWTYILFVACLSGHTEVVKKMHQNGVQMIPKIKNALLGKSLIGEKFSQEHSILHYAAKGNNDSCLRLVLRILLDKNLSVEIGDILKCVKFVGETGNVKMLDILLESSGIGIPKDAELSSVFLEGAKRCHEAFCLRLVESANIDPRFSDSNGRNVLHYAGLFGLSKLAKAITDKDPRTVDIPDNFDMSPIDYARQMGRRETITIFKACSSKKAADLKEDVLEANGWFSLLMEENTKMKMEQSLSGRSPRFHVRHLSLETLLISGDDQAASIYLSICKDELNTYLIKFPNGVEILHLIAKHGCIKSLKVILNALDETTDVDTVLNMEYKLITPLATAIKYKRIECMQALLSHSSEKARQWKSNITGENILHYAIKSENIEIVSILMAEEFAQNLRHSPDLRGLTPIACAASLGLHAILHVMCGEGEATDKNHISHMNDASFYCTECIFDRCVGWSKLYQSGHIFEKNIRGENVSLLMELDQRFTSVSSNRASRFYYDNDQIRWLFSFPAANDTLARSVVTALGCNASTTPYRRQDQMKAFSDFLVNKILDEDESIPISIVHCLASSGKIAFLKSMQDFWKVHGRHEGNRRYDESLSESAYAFGFLNVGRYIDSEIRKTGDTPKYRHFEQLRNILPPKILWCTGLSHPGDDIWQQSIVEEGSRMSFADVWIISSMEISLLEEMEKKANLTDMVPKDCQGKKLSMDVESFRKQKQLMSKNEVWLRAFLASSLIYGRLSSLMRCSDSKLTDSTSLKVKCLTESYGEQAKTTTEVDGSLTESIILKTVDNAIVIQYDEGPQNRTTESQIRVRVQSEILPTLEEQIRTMINGRQVSLRVDWRSIESRRISSSYRQILGALCGDEFDNALGGLQDVIRHCEDMLENIKKMFSPETANLALSLMSQNTEIIVRYIDSTPSSQTQSKPSFFMPNPTWVWSFTIDAGVLKYDRSALPLWNIIKLYHTVCINLITGLTNIAFESKPVNDILSRRGVTINRRHSTISSDRVSVQPENGTMKLSSRDSDQITSRGKKQKDINRRNITFDIDIRSFSKIQSSEVIAQMFRDKIYYEMCLLDVTYKGLLWFDTFIHRFVLSGTSAKHGSSIAISNGTLSLDFNVRPAQNGKWVVDSLDSLQKLNQIEERELRQSWTEGAIPDAEKYAQTVVQEIKEKTGLSVALNIDEQMIMSSVIENNRNEMEHPFMIAAILTKIATTRLSAYFTESIKKFIEWDVSLMDWMTVNLPPGLWYVPTMKTLRKDNFLGKVLIQRTVPSKLKSHDRRNSSLNRHRTWLRNQWTYNICNDFKGLELLNSKDELPKSFENVHGVWVQKPFHKLKILPDAYKNDRLQLLSLNGRLYRILDRKTLLDFLQMFPLKKLVGQDAMKSAERLSCNFFDPNVPTTETRAIDPKLHPLILGLDKELCTLLDKLPLRLFRFGVNVSINWSSFVSKEKGLTETKLITSIEALINTFHQFINKRHLIHDRFGCEFVENVRKVISHTLGKLVTLYVSCKSEDQVAHHKGLRIVHGFLYGEKCDVLILSETEINIIVTGRKQNATFLKTFEGAVVQMIELDLEKEFALNKDEAERAKTNTDLKLTLSVTKLDSNQSGESKNKTIANNGPDEYFSESKTPLDLHLASVVSPYVRDGLMYIRDSLRRKLPKFFHISLLQASDNQTTIKCENGTLEICVSPMDLTAETILKKLISLSVPLENTSTLRATDANDVIFNVDSAFYFPKIGTNTFTLDICMKTGNGVSESFLEALSKDSFEIKANSADTTLVVNSVQKIDSNKFKIDWIAPENVKEDDDVLITVLGHQIGNIKPHIFEPHDAFYTNVSPHEDKMALSTCKESSFFFFFEHDLQCIAQDSANVHLKGNGATTDPKNLCHKTVHLSQSRGWSHDSTFALIFSYQKRKYPGIGKRKPFKLTWEHNRRILVRYTCLDSYRKVHIRALCKTCKCYLRIYTPFFSVPPNKSLICYPK
ncbi:hypothetical protein CHS0354_006241 [Potamilus streckersoni]|uniref:Uncharacterized protein n=1 Tax=Potamilus streckersoni TaxID=2493646 RepID=A0AAE0S429_9BIVA|nr:hypothetical protein CHS0354_006241 [Potamilus streckersoni]